MSLDAELRLVAKIIATGDLRSVLRSNISQVMFSNTEAKEIFKFITQSKAFSIAGGGHTVAAIEQMKLRGKISHISTGGGALEKFMMGEKLAVVEALKTAKQRQLIHVK